VADRLFRFRFADFPAAETDYLRYAATLDGSRARSQLQFRPRFGVAEAVRAALRTEVFDGGVEATSHGVVG
jgi:hypothetical protein